jgi:hypothetical protein
MPTSASAAKRCDGVIPTQLGTRGADTIRGTAGADVISAGAGDDIVTGLGGDDSICAGPGDDRIDGGDGVDVIRAGAGDDMLVGAAGHDYLKGQGGDDVGDGGDGIDACLVEKMDGCESDLSPLGFASDPFGQQPDGQTLRHLRVGIRTSGPSAVSGGYLELTLPAGAEFVPESSDSRCQLLSAYEVRCSGGVIAPTTFNGPYPAAGFGVSVRVPECPPPETHLEFLLYVADLYTTDPVPDNNLLSQTLVINPAPSCA